MVLPASFSTRRPGGVRRAARRLRRRAGVRARPSRRCARDWAGAAAVLPRTVKVAHPLSGRPEELRADARHAARRGAQRALRAGARGRAAGGDRRGGARRLRAAGRPGRDLRSRKATQLAMGMHFSVVCAEDVPRLATSGRPPGRRLRQRFAALLPAALRRAGRAARCRRRSTALPRAASPVLLLSGGIDPATPPRHGERVAARARSDGAPRRRRQRRPRRDRHRLHARRGLPLHRRGDDRDALAVDAGCAASVPRPPAFLPVDADAACDGLEAAR